MDISGTVEIDFPSDSDDLDLQVNEYTSSSSSSETLQMKAKWKVLLFIKHLTNIRSIHLNFRKRMIKSKPVIVILIINLLQAFCFNVTTISTFQMMSRSDLNTTAGISFVTLQTGGFSALFNPIGGFLGDVIGRHIVSVICLFTSFLASVLHAVLLSFWNHYSWIYILVLILITISDGCFSMNWLTFGADQLINSPSEQISSYIYWWSWTKNLGAVLALLTHTALTSVTYDYNWLDDDTGFIYPVMICVTCTVLSSLVYIIALVLDLAVSSMYDRKRIISNPIKLIFGVFKSAFISKPRRVPFRSAFDYGEDPPSGLDHALIHHGGAYTEEEVESVRSCGRIALMILVITMNGFFAIYFAFHTLTANDFNNILNNSSLSNFINATLTDSLSSLIDNSLTVILLPAWNLLLLPFLGHYAPNTRKRIGLGSTLGVLGMIVAAIIAVCSWYKQTNDDGGFYMIIPLSIIVLGATFVIVPGMEFIYAQSPDNMKGLLIGFQFFLVGAWAAIAAGITYTRHIPQNTIPIVYYYIGYCILGIVGLAVFMVASYHYTNRKRNNPITDIMRISSYY